MKVNKIYWYLNKNISKFDFDLFVSSYFEIRTTVWRDNFYLLKFSYICIN